MNAAALGLPSTPHLHEQLVVACAIISPLQLPHICLGRPAGGPAPGRGSATLADVDPLAVVPTVSFDDVGGLDHHIQALKEMVMLPLLYPEVSATPMRMYWFLNAVG